MCARITNLQHHCRNRTALFRFDGRSVFAFFAVAIAVARDTTNSVETLPTVFSVIDKIHIVCRDQHELFAERIYMMRSCALQCAQKTKIWLARRMTWFGCVSFALNRPEVGRFTIGWCTNELSEKWNMVIRRKLLLFSMRKIQIKQFRLIAIDIEQCARARYNGKCP